MLTHQTLERSSAERLLMTVPGHRHHHGHTRPMLCLEPT